MNHDSSFPSEFLWGTATAAHQVEGNNTNSDWWAFEQEPGRIYGGDVSGVAVDHYLAERPEDERSASAERSEADVADAAHNQFYGLVVGLRGWRRITAVV